MRRPFREALASTPVVLEIVPPGRRVTEKAVNTFVERVRDSVRSLKNLDAVNIPEVLEENHAGQPFYRDLDPRDFAALLGDLGVDPIVTVLRAYGRRCSSQNLKPATVLLSFAPVSDYQDIEFLVWLGATVSSRTEEALLPSPGGPPGRASLDVAHTLWSHLHAAAAQSQPPVPLGVNIEEVSAHNFDLAVQMAREFPSWHGGEKGPAIPGIATEPGGTNRSHGSR